MLSTTLLVLSTYAVIVASAQTARLHKSDYDGEQVFKHGLEKDNPRGTSEETTELQGHRHEPASKELHREAGHYLTKEHLNSTKTKSGHNLIGSNAKSRRKRHKRTLLSERLSKSKRSLDGSKPWSMKYEGRRWNVLPKIVNEPSNKESERVRASGTVRYGGRRRFNIEDPTWLWEDPPINKPNILREEVDKAPRIHSRYREQVPWAYSPHHKKPKAYPSPARSRRQPVNLVD